MNMRDASDRELGLIAARQHGLFSREQARAAGLTAAMIHRRLRDGTWVRVGSGVYRIAGAPVTWEQRALAACLLAGSGALVSHRSAAVVHKVTGFRPGPLHITVPAGRSSRNSLATIHRSGLLLPRDRTNVNRIPVTHPARMLVDLASEVPRPMLEDAVDDVLCRHLTSLDRLRSTVDMPSTGRHGVPILREILEVWDGDSGRSELSEMRLIRELVARGLPRPVRQFEIRINGRSYWIDIAWPPVRLGIELDSFRWHAGRHPFRKDRQRANRIAAAGWQLLRATTEDAHDSHDLVEAAVTIFQAAA